MPITLNGRPCLDPKRIAAQLQDRGRPTPPWWGKVNSYQCQLGPKPAVAELLIDSRVWEDIEQDLEFELTFEDDKKKLTIPGLMVDSVDNYGDANHTVRPMHVVLKDWRIGTYRNRMNVYNRVINVFTSPEFQSDQTTLQTWAQVVTSLWNSIRYSKPGADNEFPGLPFSPHGKPINLSYSHENSDIDSLCDLLTRLGCALKFDPVAMKNSIARLGEADPAADKIIAELKQGKLLWWDQSEQRKPIARYPQVVMQSYSSRQYQTHHNYYAKAKGRKIGEEPKELGDFEKPANFWDYIGEYIYDDMIVLSPEDGIQYPNGYKQSPVDDTRWEWKSYPFNGGVGYDYSETQDDRYPIAPAWYHPEKRREERVADYLRIAKRYATTDGLAFIGVQPELLNCLGSQWNHFAIYDRSDGLITEIAATSSVLREYVAWRPSRPPSKPLAAIWSSGEVTGANTTPGPGPDDFAGDYTDPTNQQINSIAVPKFHYVMVTATWIISAKPKTIGQTAEFWVSILPLKESGNVETNAVYASYVWPKTKVKARINVPAPSATAIDSDFDGQPVCMTATFFAKDLPTGVLTANADTKSQRLRLAMCVSGTGIIRVHQSSMVAQCVAVMPPPIAGTPA